MDPTVGAWKGKHSLMAYIKGQSLSCYLVSELSPSFTFEALFAFA
jgi:hypothetical protein